ncbi:MAG: hypothetical protein WD360_05260 [Nitriliruptoraceae bacterium]
MSATLRRRWLQIVSLTIAILMLQSQAAFAWTVPGAGTANTFATLLIADVAPSASVSAGTATVSWDAVALAGSATVATGYTINRVWRGAGAGPDGQADGDKEPAVGACAGTITALTCTTSHGVDQTWSYTLTPLYAGWIGTESPESTPVTQGPPPTVTAITQANASGELNAGDQFTITFSEVLDPQSICSDFNTSLSDTQIRTGLTLEFAGNPNVISVTNAGTCGTVGLGTLQVGGNGNGRYTKGGKGGGVISAEGSTLTWNPTARTITVTFGTIVGNTNTGVAAATAVYTPGALTGNGFPIVAGPYNSANAEGF